MSEVHLTLLNAVRLVLAEMKEASPVFYPSEFQFYARANCEKFRLPLVSFEFGSASPYSQRLDDALLFLVLNGEVEISPQNSCELIISDRLKQIQRTETDCQKKCEA